MRLSLRARLSQDAGTTLVETLIASGLLVIMLVGLLSMGALATMHTENQGHLAARTTEYAQDKMEQLLALKYYDLASNTVVFPATSSGGSGLNPGGSSNPSAPVNLYVDWLGNDGSMLGGGITPPAGWQYERVWLIECISLPTTACTPDANSINPGLKRLTVTVKAASALGGQLVPQSTLISLKAGQLP